MIDAAHSKPDVVAIIVNWNCLPDVLLCISRLEGVPVVVVDNCSDNRDEVKQALRSSRADVLFNESNLGYGGGMNVGLRWAPVSYTHLTLPTM